MKRQVLVATAFAFLTTICAWSQDAGKSNPIYTVTVIERTVRAVNYQYRGAPTQIDFQGTVLLPSAKGEATVESKAGRTEISAKLERLTPPYRFGTGYLTYVLWAITPEGHAKNLGELVAGSSDRAHLQVTTDLQAFGMIVTAEPYAAVRQPSDVVVAENFIRPDTIGKSMPIEARYELLPRGHYTFVVPDSSKEMPGGPKVSMDRYEATLQLYEAQNAVQIARSLGADRYAPEVMRKAVTSLSTAEALHARKAERSAIVMAAREAAQTAEDARMISIERQRTDELAAAKAQLAAQNASLVKAEAEAKTAQADRLATQTLLEQERAARRRAEEEAAARPVPAEAPPPPTVVIVEPPARTTPEKREMRATMLRQLNELRATRDTPRGLVVTLSDADFRGGLLKPGVDPTLSRIAQVLSAKPGLSVGVEGHTDSAAEPEGERLSRDRAFAIRDALVRGGVPTSWISARGFGGERPVAANTTATGREQNRRVEIVISGDPIGALASWDRTYSPVPRR